MDLRTYLKSAGLCAFGVLMTSVVLAEEGGHRQGTLPSAFPYEITVPKNWNRIVINDLDAVANGKSDIVGYLLEQGYAYAGTGRHPERMTKHDPLTELEAQIAVLDLFEKEFGKPRYKIQYGCSGGGFVALAMAEQHPDKIDGAIAFNARGTGGMAVANTWLDLPFALKALLAPGSSLLVAPVPNDALPAAYDAWKESLENAQKTPQGRARIALAVALTQWPTWGSINDSPSKPVEGDLDSLQKAMFKSASDGISNSINRRQLYDNPQGLASWNTGIDYAHAYELGANPKQKRIVEQLYEQAGLDGKAGIASDLDKINRQPRIEGSSGGVNYWLKPGRLLDGKIKVPLLHVHGVGDALLPPHLTAGYAVAIAKAGNSDLYRQAFIDAAGHCHTNTAETYAAIAAMVERLENGRWGDTSPEGLNKRAPSANLEKPRYIDYTFATPFNRAFYVGSQHP